MGEETARTVYGYDAEGNLTSLVDPKGQAFAYEYDDLNRRIGADYPDTGSPYLTLVAVDTEYDANGNLTRVTETKTAPDGGVTDVTENTYDDFDRLSASTRRGREITYGYDANGNRTRVNTPWTGYQAQHIIPSQLKNHPVLQKIGMNMDDAANGIFLPSAKAKPAGTFSALPRHTGSHPSYTEAIRRQLKNLDLNANVNQLSSQVSIIQQRARVLHQQGVPVRNVDGATTALWERLLSQ
jgi:YD repeat-containing protein